MRLISYTTKPGRAAENRDQIAGVMDDLRQSALADIRYTVLESGDGTFLHVVDSTPHASEALQNLPAFRTFLSGLEDRQEAPPVIKELKVVGNYGRLIAE